MVDIDIKELDKVVFKDNKQKIQFYKYEDEDSYINPSMTSMN